MPLQTILKNGDLVELLPLKRSHHHYIGYLYPKLEKQELPSEDTGKINLRTTLQIK